ncbi:response regulator [Aurantivibrio plasticivorans]
MSKSLLVIEDNPDNQCLVTWILEDGGYDVTCADTAEAGLDLLAQASYDCILMDISLPGIDGKEATRRIRENEHWRDLPVIALTAHAIKGETADIFASGVNDLITKPVDEEKLLACLKALIHH